MDTSLRRAGEHPGARTLPIGLTGVLVAIGALLRVAQYLSNRSLFLDEACLAMNVLNRSFAGLLRPLDLMQVSPAGFLLLEKLSVRLFGESEYALRLVPLVAGLASLLLFQRVARRCLPPSAVAAAVGLFALSGPLIDYSSTVKQYSLDVAITLLLLDAALRVRAEVAGWRPVAMLAALGAIAIWFSHPAVFVLAGLGTTLAVSAFFRGERSRARLLAGTALLWLGSFAALWAVSLRATTNNSTMAAQWAFGFPRSSTDILWPARVVGGLFEYAAGPSFRGLGLLALLVGCLVLARTGRETLALLTAPFLVTLLAGAIHRYPFADRLLLFLLPFLLLLVGGGAERVREALGRSAPAAGAVWLTLLFFHPVRDAATALARPRTREEMRPVLAEVLQKRQPDDRIYVYHSATCGFLYYSRRFGIHSEEATFGAPTTADWNVYRRELEGLRGGGRTWVLFSHVFEEGGANEEKLFLFFLDGIGRRLDALHAPGAAAYLYDMSGQSGNDEKERASVMSSKS